MLSDVGTGSRQRILFIALLLRLTWCGPGTPSPADTSSLELECRRGERREVQREEPEVPNLSHALVWPGMRDFTSPSLFLCLETTV